MLHVATSSPPAFSMTSGEFGSSETHTEPESVSSPRNLPDEPTQSVSDELDSSPPPILTKSRVDLDCCIESELIESQSAPAEDLFSSNGKVGQKTLQRSAESSQGQGIASPEGYRSLMSNNTCSESTSQENSALSLPPDNFTELHQPRPHLAQPIIPSPYQSTSPSESPPSLTPLVPDESDAPQVSRPTLLLDPIANDFSPLGEFGPLSDRRRHSSAALSPTAETGDLLQPVQFPEQRRYSLIDAGPVAGPGAGRRTVSDVGQTAFVPSSQRRFRITSNAGDTESASTSRSGSRPATARFSTFEEMGIQSFAMVEGEKTVDTTKKGRGKSKYKEAKSKKRKGDKAKEPKDEREEKPSEENETDDREGVEGLGVRARGSEMTVTKADGEKAKKANVKGKVNVKRGIDCVIM